MKTIKKKGFLPTLNAMGRSGLVKTPAAFQIANKINGFEHISYETALISFRNFFWCAAMIETMVALICLFGNRIGVKIGLIAWLATSFLLECV